MGGSESKPRPKPIPKPDPVVPEVPKEEKIGPKELIRLMNENPDVVLRYYNTNRKFIEQYIVQNFWEEDVERWLIQIRERSPAEELQVRVVDFLKDKNGTAHHTELYENKALVVRRAAQFDLVVHFGNRAYDPARDDLTLVFSIGSKPSETIGTKLVLPVVAEPADPGSWYCHAVQSGSKKLALKVNVPSNAIVGRYEVVVEIVSGTSEGRVRSTFTGEEEGVIVLFNPFVEADTVYMADEKQRAEYVLNDAGFIPTGSYWRISHKRWDFAQFDDGVLDNVLKMIKNDSRLLAQPSKGWKKCNSPVYLSRVLSAMVNVNDDRGVLWGRWDGDYDDGKSPQFWSNSGKILKQWADSGMQPVKYGQCWVFSGILTTALRAIGIPARCITNFASAHDTNANVTVDMFFDADTGDKLNETSDSVWNFHVWNEGFFRRPDLPEGYDGWQVVDATPQEVSDVVDPVSGRRQLFQCGPAPVKAIKEGEINTGFDGNFIFGEVNADKAYWVVKNKKVSLSQILKRDVGKNISTKAVGSDVRSDVTDEYKYPEGSEEERVAFKKAYGRGTQDHSTWGIRNPDAELVEPKFKVEVLQTQDTVLLGSVVSTAIKVKNVSGSKSNVSVKVAANSKRHVGSVHAILKREVKAVEIDAGEVVEFAFEVDLSEHVRRIVDNKVITVLVVATDAEDGTTTVGEKDIQLDLPECFTTTAPETVPRGVVSKFDVVFENKFPFALTKGVLEVTFRGVAEDKRVFAVEKPIAPGEKFSANVSVTPLKNWSRVYVTADFDSVEVRDVQHSFRIGIV